MATATVNRDAFGGIAVDAPQTDEFGGLAVDTAQSSPQAPVAAPDSLIGTIQGALKKPSPEWLQPFETAVKHNVEPFIEHPVESAYKMVVPQKEDIQAIKEVFTDPKKAFRRDTPIGSQEWWDQAVGYGLPMVIGAGAAKFSPKFKGIREALSPEDVLHGTLPTESGVSKGLQPKFEETESISAQPQPETPTVEAKPLEKPDLETGLPADKAVTQRFPAAVERSQDGGFSDDPLVRFVIDDMGGIMSKSAAKVRMGERFRANQYDDAPSFADPRHNKVYDPKSGQLPDTIATAAADAGLLPDGADSSTLFARLQDISASAKRRAIQERSQIRDLGELEKKQRSFTAAIAKAEKGERPITASELSVGDTVTINGEPMKVTDIDPDTFDVTVEDGSKFGIQHIENDQVFYGEHKSTQLESVQFVSETTEPSSSGVSAKAFERVYGEGEIPVGESMSPEEIFAQGQRDLASGADPYALAAKARAGEVAPRELGLLAAEHHRLVSEAAAREGTPEYEAAYQQAHDFARNMLKPAGTRWHQMGMGLQVEAPIDYSNLTGFRRAVNERLGREMTPQEAPAFKRIAGDVARAGEEAKISAVEGANKAARHYAKVKDISFDEAAKSLHEAIGEAVKQCGL